MLVPIYIFIFIYQMNNIDNLFIINSNYNRILFNNKIVISIYY